VAVLAPAWTGESQQAMARIGESARKYVA
jgi:hypothetical protein